MNKEENTLTIEAYISWKNKRFALKDFIKEALKEIEDNKNKIDKVIEYINYSLNNQLCDEREALKYTLDILRGEDNE